jgi:hypothetical protein
VQAVRSLSSKKFISQETIAALLQALRDPAREVRVAAAHSLGFLSTQKATSVTLQSAVGALTGEEIEADMEAHASITS